ncbi:TPA: IS66 family insertion sequence element accessory protein TnpB [Salmonella enterica subsp. enterica serovar Muenchen]|nr:IS66 family insertion sequence element accessory protein TnpB [Salmonella enterica subsp. enterica serovar Muenchen]HEC8861216.1 IS66 family insertion sequence element accessory protein TnpB [Salmonella enterica subsp. enterica serovar Muenchen]
MRYDFQRSQVQNTLRADPYGSHLFIFVGRRGDRINVLCADRSGLRLFTRRPSQVAGTANDNPKNGGV